MKKRKILILLLFSFLVSCNNNTNSSSDKKSVEQFSSVPPMSLESTSNGDLPSVELNSENTNSQKIEVESIDFKTQLSTLRSGNSYNLEYEILPENADDKTLKLTSSNPDVVSVTSTKTILAKNKGDATLIVTSSNGKTAQMQVTVIGPEIFMLVLSASKTNIAIGETLQLDTILTPEDAEYEKIIYESDNIEIASVDDTGLLTGLSEGHASITAKIQKDDGSFVSDSLEFTVSFVHVETINILSTFDSLIVGESEQLSYEIIPSNATNQTVTFSSSDEEVATIDALGNITPLKAGNTILKVTAADGDIYAQLPIIVETSYSVHYEEMIEKLDASTELEQALVLSASFTSHKISLSGNVTDSQENISFYSEDGHLFSNISTTISNNTETKMYHGFDSDNNKYFSYKYDVSTGNISQTNIYDGDTSDLQTTYKKQAQLIYNSNWNTYGIAEYAKKMITSSSTIGASILNNANKQVVIDDNNLIVSVKHEDTLQYASYAYYDISFTIEFNSDGSISSTHYISKKYDKENYSLENHMVNENATYELDEQIYQLTYGSRSKDTSDFNPYKMLFFNSFEMGLYDSYSSNQPIESIQTNTYFYIKVKEANPTTASMKTDKIQITDVEFIEGNKSLTKDSFSYNSSSEYYYAKSSSVGKYKIHFESTINKIQAILDIEITSPKPTSIDPYYGTEEKSFPRNGMTVYIGDELVLSGKVFPAGTLQDYIIKASNDNVNLTKQSDGSYLMRVVSKDYDNATTILSWTTPHNENVETLRTINIEEKIQSELTLETLQTLFSTGNYQASISKSTHTYVFNSDNTGRVGFDSSSSYGYIDFSYQITEDTEKFIITFVITDASHDKYVEQNQYIYPINIQKSSNGKSFSGHIDGNYSISATYIWIAN